MSPRAASTTSRATACCISRDVATGIVGGRELELQREAVQRPQPFRRRVVVETRAGLARRLHRRAHPDDEIGDDRIAAAPEVRVEVALDRVHVVLRGELARLAAERGVVGEEDARLDADGPRPAVGGDLRLRLRGARHRHGRAVEVRPIRTCPRRSPTRRRARTRPAAGAGRACRCRSWPRAGPWPGPPRARPAPPRAAWLQAGCAGV